MALLWLIFSQETTWGSLWSCNHTGRAGPGLTLILVTCTQSIWNPVSQELSPMGPLGRLQGPFRKAIKFNGAAITQVCYRKVVLTVKGS